MSNVEQEKIPDINDQFFDALDGQNITPLTPEGVLALNLKRLAPGHQVSFLRWSSRERDVIEQPDPKNPHDHLIMTMGASSELRNALYMWQLALIKCSSLSVVHKVPPFATLGALYYAGRGEELNTYTPVIPEKIQQDMLVPLYLKYRDCMFYENDERIPILSAYVRRLAKGSLYYETDSRKGGDEVVLRILQHNEVIPRPTAPVVQRAGKIIKFKRPNS